MTLSKAQQIKVRGGIAAIEKADTRQIFGAHVQELKAALEAGRIEQKKNLLINFPNSSTVFGDTLYLSEGFFSDSMNFFGRGAILIHEAVHFWQWRREQSFLYRYLANPRFRFEMEIAAERPQVFYLAMIGEISESDNLRELWIRTAAKNFKKEYLLFPFVSTAEIEERYRQAIDDIRKGEGL